jgi:putative membrane protein
MFLAKPRRFGLPQRLSQYAMFPCPKQQCHTRRLFSAATTPTSSATTTTSTVDITEETLPKPQFYVPKNERDNRSIFELDHLVGGTRLARNSRTCPTRELNFGHLTWGRHKSPYRKFRHMANLFRAAGFQRLLFPDLFCVSAVAGCLTYYNEVFVMAAAAAASTESSAVMMSMSPTAFAGATTAIGLLAGFRLNNSYGRYRDGRKQWSEVNTTLRDFARQTLMWIPARNDQNNEELRLAQRRMLRLCQAFPITLIFHLNDKGAHHNMKRKAKPGEASFKDRVQAEFEAELYDCMHYTSKSSSGDVIFTGDVNPVLLEDLDRIVSVKKRGGNAPLEVLTCMAETIAVCAAHDLHPMYIREFDAQVQRLCGALGGGERIVKTPLPTGFTRHSSRLLFIWSNCLPFALYPLLGPMGTLPTVLLTSYAVLGIEDISVQLEEPFDILPLRQYSDGAIESIQAIEESYNPPPFRKRK